MNTLGKHSLNVFLKLNLGNFFKSGGMLFHSLARLLEGCKKIQREEWREICRKQNKFEAEHASAKPEFD